MKKIKIMTKNTVIASAFLSALACVTATYLFQVFTKKDWAKAFERSFFQVFAIAVMTITILEKIEK